MLEASESHTEIADTRICALMLFEAEDQCLCSFVRSFERQGFVVTALIFDGCHVQHKNGMHMEALLKQAEQDVLAETGYYIELAEKPLYQQQHTPFL